MNKEEIYLIKELFKFKTEKSNFAKKQEYASAASIRDIEKKYEIKLVEYVINSKLFYELDLNDVLGNRQNGTSELVYEYFKRRFNFEYPNLLIEEVDIKNADNVIKSIERFEKLEYLGI